MSFPSKGQRAGLAATRRSTRLSAADSASDRCVLSSTATSIPETPSKRPTRRSAKNTATSATPEQGPVKSSPALNSRQSDASERVMDHSRSGRNESSRKRKKPTRSTFNFGEDGMDYLMKPATAEDRQKWKGWCEVESEPAFFNVMLREFGVKGIKVQEVISLDEEMLVFLPKPVYGLIFLFQFKDDDPTKQEATCPDHIWFANQTTSNACATIALLNIIMNIPDIELGPTLESLKDFTATMTPAMCGYQVSNHDYIRQVHNSYTRKMDMLNADLALFNEANAKKSRKKAVAGKNAQEEQDQAGFHFIAFVPIQGSVWKLDGLERQPMNLGNFDQDWMNIVRPTIEERMQQYEGNQLRFNLLSLCRSPLLTIPKELAANVRTLSTVEMNLGHLQPDWQQFVEDLESDSVLRGPNVIYKLTQELLDAAQISKPIMDKLGEAETTADNLFQMRQELISAQVALRGEIIDEVAAIDQDDQRAMSRRHDYTPMIYTWIKFLAENGTLQSLVEAAERA